FYPFYHLCNIYRHHAAGDAQADVKRDGLDVPAIAGGKDELPRIDQLGDHGGRGGRDQEGNEEGDGEIEQEYFEDEDDPGERAVEHRSEAAGRTAGEEKDGIFGRKPEVAA